MEKLDEMELKVLKEVTRKLAKSDDVVKIERLGEKYPWLSPTVVESDLRFQRTAARCDRISTAGMITALVGLAETGGAVALRGDLWQIMIGLVVAGVSLTVATGAVLRQVVDGMEVNPIDAAYRDAVRMEITNGIG